MVAKDGSKLSGARAWVRFRVIDHLRGKSTPRVPSTFNYEIALGILLLISFLAVCVFIKNYGASWDELLINEYSQRLPSIYQNLAHGLPYQSLIVFHDLQYYGPVYWALANAAIGPIVTLFPTLDRFDAFNLLNFATFLIGVGCLFCLLRRFVSPQAAFVASLLYLTQPLLWGHGVINPKDTPFATFFLGAMLAGVYMLETQAAPATEREGRWRLMNGKRKYWAGLCLAMTLILAADLIFDHFISQPLLSALIARLYASKPGDIFHAVLQRLASNWAVTPQIAYIEKTMHLIHFVEFATVVIVAFLAVAIWFARADARKRMVLITGAIAGLATATRVLGLAAIGLVGLYAIFKSGKKSIPMMIGCLAAAIGVAFASWPYLWSAPLSHFLDSWRLMADFPWQGSVRFEGVDLNPTNLPWYYLPKLMAVQLTLPAVGLAVVGMGLSIKKIFKKLLHWEWTIIAFLWFFVPVVWVMLTHPPLYDNFRQFLFILPPLFFFASATLDAVFQSMTALLWRGLVIASVLLPGIVAILWLHPYEYIYYNALVGWTAQAGRSYEGDYWLTSFCEAARYLNGTAADGSRIAFTEGSGISIFARCQRKNFVDVIENSNEIAHASYSVLSSRYNADLKYYPEMQAIKVIGRGASVFCVIKTTNTLTILP